MNPYGVKVGYAKPEITDFSNHPANLGWKGTWIPSISKFSTAAGAYQFIKPTWNSLKLPDFTETSQDKGFEILIKQAKAFELINLGNFEEAIHKLAPVWASLPLARTAIIAGKTRQRNESAYPGQKAWTMDKCLKFIDDFKKKV
jgi:muramidase (phage lysozyme)